LDGFVPTENLRFRETVLTFKVSEKSDEEEIKKLYNYQYPDMSKNLGGFELQVKGGSFTDSEIVVLLGENGTGKTTLIRMLAGNLDPDHNGNIIIVFYKIYLIKIVIK
jgi:ATP-binding cassette subfamily E protein 1